jgi:hypothetical protein
VEAVLQVPLGNILTFFNQLLSYHS